MTYLKAQNALGLDKIFFKYNSYCCTCFFIWKGILYKLYIPYFENTFKKTNELKYLQHYTYSIYRLF